MPDPTGQPTWLYYQPIYNLADVNPNAQYAADMLPSVHGTASLPFFRKSFRGDD